jgi:hypothetical protein
MWGDCQRVYQHCIETEKGAVGPRISMVFKLAHDAAH